MTKKQKRQFIEQTKDRLKRVLSGTLAMYMLFTSLFVVFPSSQSYALTGGPSQPEVQSFEPIGTSDMVDLFSGDFTYNIPLLDVEGYPINLAYHSGVTMDQEASWVGLGWNVNVGTINRALRGLPDDFNGDEVRTELNIRPNVTVGISAEVGDLETFGKKIDLENIGVSLGANIGINYNNYNGVGFDIGLKGSKTATKFNVLGFTPKLGMGLNSNSAGGLSISPTVSLDRKLKDGKKGAERGLSLSVGSAFNSRQGLSSLSVGANLTAQANSKTVKDSNGKDVSVRVKHNGSNGPSSSFSLMQTTYTPAIQHSMNSFAISGRFKVAISGFGADAGLSLGANYSEQKLANGENDKRVRSYGYLYSENATDSDKIRTDFNRENQGSVSPATPNLALANYTYDIYSVSGQGIGGSYRPYRGQIGQVYDNIATNKSFSVPLSLETGVGVIGHLGGNIAVTTVKSSSGPWRDAPLATSLTNGITTANTAINNTNILPNVSLNAYYFDPLFDGSNYADDKLSFKSKGGDNDFENVSFREANEMSVMTDEDLYTNFGGDEAVRIELIEGAKFKVSANDRIVIGTGSSNTKPITRNYQKERTKRNNTIQNLTVANVKAGMGIVDFDPLSYAATYGEDHHMGQIISLGTDGMRYVYGQPAYNKTQQEVTFAVGQTVNNEDFPGGIDYNAGLVTYSPSGSKADNSIGNKWGLDRYFQRVTTPDYTHSFLLNAVVSDDYVDVDGVKGPTDGDLGSWTKFKYDRVDDYRWRVPVQKNMASYSEGLKGDPQDDKASYLYGEKELFYLDTIETKNFIAVFKKSNREDAIGVADHNGGLDDTKRMQKLDEISLYSKEDIRLNGANATSLKTVHFVYDYELCPGIPNNVNQGGKLTLKKVYFTYRDSKKGKLSPYSFDYCRKDANENSINNYAYNLKSYDRWGCYKPNNAITGDYDESDLATFEFPYVDQDQVSADLYTSAWTLTSVDLPSGGRIEAQFESDDYAHVQDKQAMSMVKIVNVGMDDGAGGQDPDTGTSMVKPISDGNHKNRRIYFEKDPTISINSYVQGIEDLYYRCLMEFDEPQGGLPKGRYDYVSGYAKFKAGTEPGNPSLGYIEFHPVSFNDLDIAKNKNPIALSGVQFGRLHLAKYVNDSPAFAENQTFGGALINTLFQTLSGFVDGFKNPNKVVYGKGRGTKIVLNKSWIRLNNVNQYKLGGGCRVANIRMFDNWSDMTSSDMAESDYGQDYDYTKIGYTLNGVDVRVSSGVASYEPQLGGDENPFKTPIRFADKKVMAPDERFYQETPLGESFFPSASVGYSRVTVRNKQYAEVKRSSTGSVVHEFYTARDFPTRVSKTDLERKQHKSKPFGLASLLKINTRDYYTGSQGFVIETNDMHGKPKAQMVYQEDQEKPITKVEYNYLQEQSGSSYRLANEVSVIHQSGEVDKRNIGVNYDLVTDFQQSKTRVFDAGASINMDIFPIVFIPGFVPTVWPSVSSDKTMFRSAVMTKVVQKFGVLESTVATDLGSVVETKNLAYDAETGQVLLTETATNYEDKVYSMSFPAYWHYDHMGQAYKNIGYKHRGNINSGMLPLPSDHKFVEGDEVMLEYVNGSYARKAWITEVDGNMATVELAAGTAPPSVLYDITIIRSGRRNMQSQMMASVTTLTNPLNSFKNNIYENVLQASAIEFSDKWRTYCDCDGSVATASTNPYFLGTKGNYKPVVSYLHLSDRTQSDHNNNTNLRKDGVFTSFRPYYKLLANGEWQVDRKDWTYTAEVTEFNPFGQELENQDALGRYSSATFGFNQTLAKAVAANARYRDIGFTSFEDDDFSDCADNHFKFDAIGVERESEDSHSGAYSVRVNSGSSATIKRDLAWCDPSDCALNITLSTKANTNLGVDVTGSTGEVRIEYDVISGSPTVVPTSSGPEVLLNGTYRIEWNVIDDAGCQATKLLTVVNGVVTP